MAKELAPTDAAVLAEGVYTVNGDSERDLKAFLANKIFSSSAQRSQVMKSELGGRVFRAAKDSFGLCARGSGKFEGDLFLIFRGTTTANNKADFVTDARCGLERSKTGFPVHIGFNHAFTSMLPEIHQYVTDSKSVGTVHCVGHSLGGAVACLAADWMASTFRYPVKLYTFGQPRTGLTMYSLFLTKKLGKNNMHRVFHTTDPVPMVPVFPYVHSPLPGYGRRVMSENPIHSGAAHRMALYADNMCNKTWSDFSLAPPINSHEDAIKGWLKSKSQSFAMCPKSLEWLENALIWLVSKQLAGLAAGIQWAGMGIHTFLDKVAWLLAKGIEVGEHCAEWVKLFLRKVSQVLGIKVPEGTTLSTAFLRFLLETLVKRANEMAMKALRGLTGRG